MLIFAYTERNNGIKRREESRMAEDTVSGAEKASASEHSRRDETQYSWKRQ